MTNTAKNLTLDQLNALAQRKRCIIHRTALKIRVLERQRQRQLERIDAEIELLVRDITPEAGQ
jgi:hypothetical protein